jgi:oligosaccharide repeat unit polymerase
MGNMFGKSEGSIVYNISVYLGGGIGLFNDYVEKGGIATPGFGVVTFVALYKFLKQFGFPDYTNYFQFEFRYDWGNIYTAIRRYYQDFGMIGVIVCMTVFAIFFSYFYSVIKKDNKPHIIDLRLLIYGMMVRSICLFFADDELFVDFCTPTFIKTIIKFWIVSYLLTNVSITKNGIKLKRNQRNYVR